MNAKQRREYEAQLDLLRTDPAKFREALFVDTDTGPKRLGEILDPWQAEDFGTLDPSWRRIARHAVEPRYLRAYLERSRGNSKTSDLATSAAWVLFATRTRVDGVACAADKDQATLLLNAVDRLLRLNPWLAQSIECQRDKIVNKETGSTLTCLASDSASSYGLLVDFCIVDEVTHWQKRDLWDSIFSAAGKKTCLLLVISNAGFKDSWQWDLREAVRTDPDWFFHRLDGPVAGWISAKHLAEQCRLLPPKVYRRLWLNEWADGAGDALELDQIQAALTLDGPSPAERGYVYSLGVDLGLTHDATALVLVGRHVGYSEPIISQRRKLHGTLAILADLDLIPSTSGDVVEYKHHAGSERLKLAAVEIFAPTPGCKVDLMLVEKRIAALHSQYGCRVSADPHQAELMLQQLHRRGIPCEAVHFSGTSLQAMATTALTEFRNRTIDLYPQPELVADLKNLRIASKSYGFRLESPHNAKTGTAHGDTATALALAMRACRQHSGIVTLPAGRRLVYN